METAIALIVLLAFLAANIVTAYCSKKFRKEAYAYLNEADAHLINAQKLLPNLSEYSTVIDAEEYIILTKKKDTYEWVIEKNCSAKAFQTYCPSLFLYFKDQDDAVKEVGRIINDNA